MSTVAVGHAEAVTAGAGAQGAGARAQSSWMKRRVIPLLGATLASSYLLYAYIAGDFTLKGPRRGAYFWLRAGPIVFAYARLHFSKGDAATPDEWEALHEYCAEIAQKIVMDLKGFYIKSGQFASARPDVMPAAYIRRFRALQNLVPPALGRDEIEEMVRRLQKDAGVDPESATKVRIQRIAGECLGAASIGQAHKCELTFPGPSGGSAAHDYCVKLQYPDAKLLFYVDLACIRILVCMLIPEMGNILRELEKQFLCEFDYVKEKSNIEQMKRNMALGSSRRDPRSLRKEVQAGALTDGEAEHIRQQLERFPYKQVFFTPELCAIPEPVSELCTEQMLVMRFLHGVKVEEGLVDGFGLKHKSPTDINARLVGGGGGGSQAGADGAEEPGAEAEARPEWQASLASKLVDCLPWLLWIRRLLQRAALLLLGATGSADAAAIEDARQVQSQAGRVMESLLGIHGEQIFYHGLFQGDPHPGNFLLLTGGSSSSGDSGTEDSARRQFSLRGSKLGLIDFGQCKSLTLEQRLSLARLVIAVADDDDKEIIRVLREEYGIGASGADGGQATDWFLEKIGRFAFGEFNSRLTDGKSLRDFSKSLAESYKNNAIPGDLYLPMRTSIMLRGLGLLLNCYVCPARSWRSMAEAVLREQV